MLSSMSIQRRNSVPIKMLVLLALVLIPPLAVFTEDQYLVVTGTRLVAFAIAALALDLILGYGAMVSFGHAAFIGLGAYSVVIAMHFGISDFFAHVVIAGAISGCFAAITGALALRTTGIYFIMITLAFGQMAYFFFVSLSSFGGDDGTAIATRSTIMGENYLGNDVVLFYVSLTMLAVVLLFATRVVESRFGRVLIGTRENHLRMQAIGFETFRFRLFAYMISGALTSITGVILANQTQFVSPAFMSWQRSGELMVMVVLGGIGNLTGSILGAGTIVILEDWLSLLTLHWRLPFGLLLVVIAIAPVTAIRRIGKLAKGANA